MEFTSICCHFDKKMPEKFNNKYRLASSRMPNWDYSRGLYFITIKTKDQFPYLGQISNGQIHLSDIGEIVKTEWLKTPFIRPDMNIILDEFSVMPDHFHGIIGIDHELFHRDRRDAMHGVSTIPVTRIEAHSKNKFGPQSKNPASIIRGFKSAVTTQARKMNIPFQWQERFHEHAIRNKNELRSIRKYVRENPSNYSKG